MLHINHFRIAKINLKTKIEVNYMLEMNILIKDMGTKNCLSNAGLYFWPKGCQPAHGQNQYKYLHMYP
jgi:hypothetical protein